METQPPKTVTSSATSNRENVGKPIAPGTAVIYGLLGRCTVAAVENRTIGGESLSFYKLEVQKPAASRSTRQEPAIWVPIRTAREQGLRLPIQGDEIDAVNRILTSREYYFAINEPWSSIHSQLEASIRSEGAVGLAKAMSYLHVLKRKQVVPTPEVARMHEQVSKLLTREIAESTGKLPRTIEEEITKMLRHKLLPDS